MMDPTACVSRHVSRTSRIVISAFDVVFAPYDMTAGQFDLMMTLREMGPQTVGSLAKLIAMDSSTVPRAIKPLLERELVSVRQGEDRRQRIIKITAAGRKRLERATAAWENRQRAVVKEFGEQNWKSLMHELSRLRGVVRQKRADDRVRRIVHD